AYPRRLSRPDCRSLLTLIARARPARVARTERPANCIPLSWTTRNERPVGWLTDVPHNRDKGNHMRNFLLILTGSTALACSLALAQAPPSGTPATGAPSPSAAATTVTLADCDRLQRFLEERRPANAGVTVEQVHTYR